MSTTKGKVTAAVVAVLVIALAGFGLTKALEVKAPVLVFTENYELTFEYGTEVELEEVTVMLDGIIDAEASNYEELDLENFEIKTEEVGDFVTEVTAKLGKEEKAFEVDYKVEDTELPTLTNVKDLTFEEGAEFEHEIKAEDKVDGELEVTITGDYDMSKPGTYELTATAKDKNDNEVTEKFKVTITEKVVEPEPEPEKPANKPSNGNGNGGTAANKPSGGNKPSGNGGSTKPPVNNGGSGSNNSGGTTPPTTPPAEDTSWKKHPKDFIGTDGVRMYFYKTHATPDACIATANSVDFKLWMLDSGYRSSICLNSEMYLTTKNN